MPFINHIKLFLCYVVIFFAMVAYGMSTYGMLAYFIIPSYSPQVIFASIPLLLFYLIGSYSTLWIAYKCFKYAKLILGV